MSASKLPPGGGDPDPQFRTAGAEREESRGWLAVLARIGRGLFAGSGGPACADCGAPTTDAGEAYLDDRGRAIWVRCVPCSTASPTPDDYAGGKPASARRR
jgi:hypothetical protein